MTGKSFRGKDHCYVAEMNCTGTVWLILVQRGTLQNLRLAQVFRLI